MMYISKTYSKEKKLNNSTVGIESLGNQCKKKNPNSINVHKEAKVRSRASNNDEMRHSYIPQ